MATMEPLTIPAKSISAALAAPKLYERPRVAELGTRGAPSVPAAKHRRAHLLYATMSDVIAPKRSKAAKRA